MSVIIVQIEDRLKFVCKEENINISDEAIKIISKSAKGGMRQALTNLEKCVIYNDLSIQGISEVLNIISDDIFKQLYDSIKSKDMNHIIDTIESIYNAGYELHLVIRQFLDYLLENRLDVSIVDTTLTVLQDIKFDNNPKNLIIARYICMK
jgi:DNA polymerase III gamma/tau subunit